MNKKGKIGTAGAIVLVLVIGLVIGGVLWFNSSLTKASPEQKIKEQAITTQLCPDTTKNAQFRVADSDSATASYLAKNVYIYDETGAFIDNVTTATSGVFQNLALCGKYTAVAVTTAGTSGASAVQNVEVYGANQPYTMSVNSLDNLQVRVKDMSTDTYQYLGVGGSLTVNQTTYTDVNKTYVASSAGDVAIAVGSDGKLDLKLLFKAETARKYFGDKLLNTFLCVDVGTNNVWQEPSVSMNGAILTNVKGSLNANDQLYSYISASEYCYNIGTPIPNAEQTVDFTISARSGQDPSTSDDVIFFFAPEGKFKSVAPSTAGQTLIGVVTDASTQAMTGTSTAYLPLVQVQVS